MTDLEMILATLTQAVDVQAKIFGPVFPRLVSQQWVRYVAEKLSETPPSVETFEEAIEYVRASTNRYPKAYTGIAYAIDKAEGILEGHVGAAATSLARQVMKDLMTSMSLDQTIGPTSGTTDALNKYVQCLEMLGLYPAGMMIGSGDEANSILRFRECEYADACDRLLKEGIGRGTGGMECFFGTTSAIAVEVLTKKQHDYKNAKIAPPDCEIQIYQIE